jgi:hypothetical protein
LNRDRIPKRSPQCNSCSARFLPGERLYSLVHQGERFDYCRNCKDKLEGQEADSRWSGRLPERQFHEERVLSGEERLLLLLREAIAEKGQEERALLLALYLERRGVIEKVRSAKRSVQYKARRSDELFKVQRVKLDAIAPEMPALLIQELEAAYGVPPQKALAMTSDCGGHLDRFAPHSGAPTLSSSRSNQSVSPRPGVHVPCLSEEVPYG